MPLLGADHLVACVFNWHDLSHRAICYAGIAYKASILLLGHGCGSHNEDDELASFLEIFAFFANRYIWNIIFSVLSEFHCQLRKDTMSNEVPVSKTRAKGWILLQSLPW